MDVTNIAVFVLGFVLLIIGLWLWSPIAALTIGGLGLMTVAVVSAVLGILSRKPEPGKNESTSGLPTR